MDVTVEIPLKRFGNWEAHSFSAERELGDGTFIAASILYELDEDDKSWYNAFLYIEKRGEYGQLIEQKLLKQDVFGYLWDAVRFCETVDLGEIETTNE